MMSKSSSSHEFMVRSGSGGALLSSTPDVPQEDQAEEGEEEDQEGPQSSSDVEMLRSTVRRSHSAKTSPVLEAAKSPVLQAAKSPVLQAAQIPSLGLLQMWREENRYKYVKARVDNLAQINEYHEEEIGSGRLDEQTTGGILGGAGSAASRTSTTSPTSSTSPLLTPSLLSGPRPTSRMALPHPPRSTTASRSTILLGKMGAAVWHRLLKDVNSIRVVVKHNFFESYLDRSVELRVILCEDRTRPARQLLKDALHETNDHLFESRGEYARSLREQVQRTAQQAKFDYCVTMSFQFAENRTRRGQADEEDDHEALLEEGEHEDQHEVLRRREDGSETASSPEDDRTLIAERPFILRSIVIRARAGYWGDAYGDPAEEEGSLEDVRDQDTVGLINFRHGGRTSSPFGHHAKDIPRINIAKLGIFAMKAPTLLRDLFPSMMSSMRRVHPVIFGDRIRTRRPMLNMIVPQQQEGGGQEDSNSYRGALLMRDEEQEDPAPATARTCGGSSSSSLPCTKTVLQDFKLFAKRCPELAMVHGIGIPSIFAACCATLAYKVASGSCCTTIDDSALAAMTGIIGCPVATCFGLKALHEEFLHCVNGVRPLGNQRGPGGQDEDDGPGVHQRHEADDEAAPLEVPENQHAPAALVRVPLGGGGRGGADEEENQGPDLVAEPQGPEPLPHQEEGAHGHAPEALEDDEPPPLELIQEVRH
ncbi:unnamed protein product [Amoebophrya sp. A25]|nr:unnamed protein product [Amoebophrya sp. A25]|eukprot:GSA25T00025027001.1